MDLIKSTLGYAFQVINSTCTVTHSIVFVTWMRIHVTKTRFHASWRVHPRGVEVVPRDQNTRPRLVEIVPRDQKTHPRLPQDQ
jgi:hypothetical protein